VPDRPAAELGELREARLARFGSVQIRVDQRTGDEGDALHATYAQTSSPEPGTDIALLAEGHPTLTRLASVGELPGVLEPALA
jgi:5'-nucleotidase